MLAAHQCGPVGRGDVIFSSAYCNRSHIIEVREEKIGEEKRGQRRREEKGGEEKRSKRREKKRGGQRREKREKRRTEEKSGGQRRRVEDRGEERRTEEKSGGQRRREGRRREPVTGRIIETYVKGPKSKQNKIARQNT